MAHGVSVDLSSRSSFCGTFCRFSIRLLLTPQKQKPDCSHGLASFFLGRISVTEHQAFLCGALAVRIQTLVQAEWSGFQSKRPDIWILKRELAAVCVVLHRISKTIVPAPMAPWTPRSQPDTSRLYTPTNAIEREMPAFILLRVSHDLTRALCHDAAAVAAILVGMHNVCLMHLQDDLHLVPASVITHDAEKQTLDWLNALGSL